MMLDKKLSYYHISICLVQRRTFKNGAIFCAHELFGGTDFYDIFTTFLRHFFTPGFRVGSKKAFIINDRMTIPVNSHVEPEYVFPLISIDILYGRTHFVLFWTKLFFSGD